MNLNKYLVGKIGILICSALLGCPSHAQPSVSVGVEIRAESDFYEPLSPHGEWLVVGSYGRCWRPSHVERGWRPYCSGSWEWTDAGWYWVSDEPWGWATYHYGRWDYADEYGWYWVPQMEWAPAWVSWHSGGGYIGWAPLYPSGRSVVESRACVFVEERHFMEPVRSATVVVASPAIISKTVVIREGPATAVIEKSGGRKVAAVPVQELRHRTEAAVVSKPPAPTARGEKQIPTPTHGEAATPEKKAVAAPALPKVEKPSAAFAPAPPAPKNDKAQGETRKSTPAPAESKPAVVPATKPEINHTPAIKEPAVQHASPQPARPEKPAQPADHSTQQPAREKPAASEKSQPAPGNKDQEKSPK